MTNIQNNRGRTFWDFIAEHPKLLFLAMMILILLVIILAVNKYSVKSSAFSIEPNGVSDNTLTKSPDSVIDNKAGQLNTTAYIQRRQNPGTTTKAITQQIIIKEPNKDTVKSQVVNVTSNYQNGGITANQVNIGSTPRILDVNLQKQLLLLLKHNQEKIYISSVMGDSEALQFAAQISNFLKSQGFANVSGLSQSVFNTPVIGQFIDRDSSGVQILIGSNTSQ